MILFTQVGEENTKYSFAFDRVFGSGETQASIYKDVAVPVIKGKMQTI